MDAQQMYVGTWSLYGMMNLLIQLIANLISSTAQVMLYTNTVTWSNNTHLSELAEVNVGGYARQSITVWDGPYTDVAGNVFAVAPLQVYVGDGTGTTGVVGMAILEGNGGTQATMTASVAGGIVDGMTITNGGTLYDAPPRVVFSGGGGSGAAATVTITNGVVTGFTITNPGSGYATPPTVTLDPPTDIVAGGPFNEDSSPIAFGGVTQAVPVVPQLTLPGGLAA